MKEVIFHEKALEGLRSFPRLMRGEIGKAIRDLQRGLILSMPLSKPMPSVALGVYELRVKDSSGCYRAFYYLKSRQGILVFHTFMKKTQKTPQHEINLAQKRLKEVLNGR
jgi:phage-related protein